MPVEQLSWAPTIAEVALHITARTRLPNGTLAETFTEETTPKAQKVQQHIEHAMNFLIPRLGPMAPRMEEQARSLAALKAACSVELAYFPEQIETATSPYKALAADFKAELCSWDMAAKAQEPNSPSHTASLHVGTLYPGYATGTT